MAPYAGARLSVQIFDGLEDEGRAIETAFGREGWSVLPPRPATAGKSAQQQLPDLFVVDVETLASGSWKSAQTDGETRNIPILLVAGKAQLEYVRSELGGAASDFVLRPFEAPEIAARARACVENFALRKNLQIKSDELHFEIEDKARIEGAFKLNEDRLDALLNLSELRSRSEEELNQFVLDECVRLTGSAMGYLHYVNEAENGFISYVWSKGAVEMCVTKEETMDFSLATAGIWADALRRRRPVVHNDYPSASEKRGLPKGHVPLQRIMTIPITKGDKIVAVLGVANKPSFYNEADQRQLVLFGNRLWSIIEGKRNEIALAKAVADLHYLATTDSLTGLANRYSLDNFLSSRWEKCAASGDRISAAMIDIDYFKAYNDTYGHQAGDEALRKIGAVLAATRQGSDSLAARYGGEEFLVVCRGLSEGELRRSASALLDEVRALKILHGSSTVSRFLTISIGLAQASPSEGSRPDDLIRAADDALYTAKKRGRDRVEPSAREL